MGSVRLARTFPTFRQKGVAVTSTAEYRTPATSTALSKTKARWRVPLHVRAGYSVEWDEDTDTTWVVVIRKGREAYRCAYGSSEADEIIAYYTARVAAVERIRRSRACRDAQFARRMHASHIKSAAPHLDPPAGLLADLALWAAVAGLGGSRARSSVGCRTSSGQRRTRSANSSRGGGSGGDDDGSGEPGEPPPAPPRGHDGGNKRSLPAEVERRRTDLLRALEVGR
jgi:hypothetical protein